MRQLLAALAARRQTLTMTVQVTPGDGTLAVAWTLPTGGHATLVKWREHPAGAWSVALAVTGCEIAGLTNGVEYDVQIVLLAGSGVVSAVGTPLGDAPSPIPPGPVVH